MTSSHLISKPMQSKIFFPESSLEADIIEIKSSTCLVIAHHPILKRGMVIFWNRSPDETAITKAVDALKQLTQPLGSQEAWIWKVIGTTAALEMTQKAFKTHKINPASEIVREANFEAFFYPFNGRLRVSAPEKFSGTCVTAPVPISSMIRSIPGKIKVLIVDDSKTIRQLLTKLFSSDPDLEVMAAIDNPTKVEDFIEKNRPDVITLDIHMPSMDGVTLLKSYLLKYPIPTVMISSLSYDDGNDVFNALDAGAVDYIQKPSFQDLAALAPLILEKVKSAARANLLRKKGAGRSPSLMATGKKLTFDQSTLIAIGSSTGGTEALREVLIHLPENIPPILCVQHIPAVFSGAFAKRLDSLCPFEVKEAEDGDEVTANRVLIAPGGLQMGLTHRHGKLKVTITQSPPVNRHCPSVDYLFRTIAESSSAAHTIGVLLTGMGSDGARGMLELKNKGARTIAQNEESCVVFGMPREAIKIGAAEEIVSLLDIPQTIHKFLSSRKKAA